MTLFRVLKSVTDASVNFVVPTEDGGALESRYVRHSPDYMNCYLSSQTGCRQACRMCHLTATKQFTDRDTTLEEFEDQLRNVFGLHYHTLIDADPRHKAKLVHFSFMARGEPLKNPLVRSGEVFPLLRAVAQAHDMRHRIQISTIMPKGMPTTLDKMFGDDDSAEIYYSLYSLDDDFRKLWLPNAMPVDQALEQLAAYQQRTRKIVKIHWALIEGHNDDPQDGVAILDRVANYGLHVDVNIVRYNPPTATVGAESPDARRARYLDALREAARSSATRIDVVERVGFDVAASCGMFVSP